MGSRYDSSRIVARAIVQKACKNKKGRASFWKKKQKLFDGFLMAF
jgi:hypothetical protein